jgi:hypothetical protein
MTLPDDTKLVGGRVVVLEALLSASVADCACVVVGASVVVGAFVVVKGCNKYKRNIIHTFLPNL